MNNQKELEIIQNLLSFIGEEPTREGLVDTPKRALNAWKELTNGYDVDIDNIMTKVFDIGVDNDEIVIVRDIPFVSTCEHHMLQFHGIVNIGYIPNPEVGVLGLSKFARLVEAYAHRLQVQERLTSQIAHEIEKYLKPLGVGVLIKAEHTCMSIRGVKCHGASTITSKMLGVFMDVPSARAELFELFKA